MKQVVKLGVLAVGLALAAPAQADDWPTRPVTLVVPFGAGGPTDVIGRIISADLSALLGQPIIIENKGGAGGNVGADSVAKAAPDGYSFLLATAGTHAINASVYPSLPFDHLSDFRGVSLIARAPNVVLVHPSVKAETLADLIALAKERPGELNLSMAGNGTTPHMTAELLKITAGIDVTLVPYKGGGAAMVGLLGNEVDMMVDNVPTATPHVQAGSVRALAVTSATRNPALPDVPPASDVLPGFESYAWWGIVAPAGTPDAIVNKMNDAVNTLLRRDDIVARYVDLGAQPQQLSPSEFDDYIRTETVKWADVVRVSGVSMQ